MIDWLFVADPGGHLAVVDWARRTLPELAGRCAFATLDTVDARDRLAGEQVVFGVGPTARSASALLVNMVRAREAVQVLQPRAVLSTGAALGVPFLLTARARGVRSIFLEVIDRVSTPSLTGRLVGPIVDEVWVQGPEQRSAYPGARVVGRLAPPARAPRPREPYVFVSFGTHQRPFERLVGLCERLAGDGRRVVVQHGASRRPRGCEGAAWIRHRELLGHLDAAEHLVLHGGTSVLAEAVAGGRVPLVVARDPAFGEHVDAHQRGLAPDEVYRRIQSPAI